LIYACEHHDQLLPLWREQGLHGIRLAHVDFHDDLRGLLIDRRRGCALPLTALDPGDEVDPGNFLAHAVLEGRVTRIRWLHTLPGGRAWDLGIVRYESDLLAWPRRWRQRLAGRSSVPLEFSETLLDDWFGIEPGERLSVDWDCFASRLQDAAGIDRRVDAFVGRLGTEPPADCYLAYSPEYSHPTLDRFRALVERLAHRFGQPVRWLSPGLPEGRLHPDAARADRAPGPLSGLILRLRRRGIYF